MWVGLALLVSYAVAVPTATAAVVSSRAAAVPAPELSWHPCAAVFQRGFQCATALVPLDYRDPSGRKIHLAVIRHRASDPARRIGTLFWNPGGPGASSTVALPQAYSFFPAAVRARFDIASWDPRGVGASTAVRCFPSMDDDLRFLDGMDGCVVPRRAGTDRHLDPALPGL